MRYNDPRWSDTTNAAIAKTKPGVAVIVSDGEGPLPRRVEQTAATPPMFLFCPWLWFIPH